MQSNSKPRASLLSGLRTGGVRSGSQTTAMPHTAAVGGSFNVPRVPSFSQQYYPDEEADELADMVNHGLHLNGAAGNQRMIPATAGPIDNNRFQSQQQAAFLQHMAAQRAANAMVMPGLGNVDPMQMQLMQLELMKLQALQQAQQQFQAELMAQSQLQQLQQQQQQRAVPSRRASAYMEVPATAAPSQTAFDLRGSVQFARSQGDSQDHDAPKTAALGGKFGGRPVLSALNPNAAAFSMSNSDEPGTPKTATAGNAGRVISGGTSLGGMSTPVHATPTPATPSKSDSAMSWRRPSAIGNSPMTPTRSSTMPSPSIRLTPSTDDGIAPSPLRQRPSPLRFNDAANGPLYVEAEAGSESDLDNYASDLAQIAMSSSVSSDAEKDSSPGTPPSAGSSNSVTREEASKRLYEGLGVGRPVQAHVPPVHIPQIKHQISQVLRQPLGPPASVDELGPRNFAARMQKKLVMVA